MRKPESLAALRTLLQKPSFSSREAKERGISSALLCHHVKTGRLLRLGRGIYQSNDYKSPPESFHWEDLIEAVYSIPGGVICLTSALAIYAITEEIPRQHWIAVPHSTSIKRGSLVRVVRLRNMSLGKTEIDLEGTRVPIFNRERTIVDAFRLLSTETAIKALKAALVRRGTERLDLKKLQSYAKKLRVNITLYLMAITT
jgi:predicted transcriptional regulator of viral defense system